MADGWLTLRHPGTGGTTRIPEAADVLAWHEARGWALADEEPERPFVPPKPADDPDAAAGEWVDLVHPDLPGATNRVPNNADALAGAAEAGWTYPEPAADEEPAVEESPKRRRKETPAADAGNDQPDEKAGEPQ